RENGYRTIKLLGEHDADELVRPGHGAEGEAEVGACEHGLAEPVRTADRHDDVAFAAIAPAAQAFGEAGAAERRAALVEGYQHALARRFGEDRHTLLVFAGLGAAGPALRNLGEIEGQTQSAAGRRRPLVIALEQIALRPGLEPADGHDSNSHGGARST